MKRATHRKDGSFRAGNKAHSLPPGEQRVVFAAQRVLPATLVMLRNYAQYAGSIGKSIDAAADALRQVDPRARGPQDSDAWDAQMVRDQKRLGAREFRRRLEGRRSR